MKKGDCSLNIWVRLAPTSWLNALSLSDLLPDPTPPRSSLVTRTLFLRREPLGSTRVKIGTFRP